MSRSWWCEYASLPTGLAPGVRITVSAGRIHAIESGCAEPESADVRLDGVTLPGLANAHSHAFHRALRGRTHGGGGTFWTWRQAMYAVAARLTPALYLDLARSVYAEMVLAGYTVVGEFHYVHHRPDGTAYEDPNAMGRALVQAAADAGIRLTLLDTCYLAGGLAGAGHEPLAPEQRRFGDGDVAAWAHRADARWDWIECYPDTRGPNRVRLGVAAHSVRAVPKGALGAVADIARDRGMPLHIHLSEQPAENVACADHYGCTPTELLVAEAALGPGTTVVHATHLTPTDIAALGQTETVACFCPTTERDLADGIGPARALAEAGAALALGSDQHAVVDPFEELRGLESHERLISGRRGRFSPAELLQAGTSAGYRSLGWDDGGRLEVGALADFVTVGLGSARTAGCLPDQIPYAASAADVTTVVVGGETVVSGGAHRLGDVGGLLARAIAAVTGADGQHGHASRGTTDADGMTETDRRRP